MSKSSVRDPVPTLNFSFFYVMITLIRDIAGKDRGRCPLLSFPFCTFFLSREIKGLGAREEGERGAHAARSGGGGKSGERHNQQFIECSHSVGTADINVSLWKK